jgi:cobalamin biosynthesis Co2+ chelatase CbiK
VNYEDLITALHVLKAEGYIEVKQPLYMLKGSGILYKINKQINDYAESK